MCLVKGKKRFEKNHFFVQDVTVNSPKSSKKGKRFVLNVVSRKTFEKVLRDLGLYNEILTHTIFHPSDYRLPAWIRILKGFYMYRKEYPLIT